MAHEIFISYSHKDKTTADAICSHLEARGMRCWYAPRDITPGVEWGNAILKGIEEARIMVLVFTRDANLSQQVLREVNNAVNAGLFIIPFRLTPEEPAAGMRYYLSTVHWMDAMNGELEQSVASLGDLCRAALDKKPVSSPASAAPAADRGKKKKLLLPALAAGGVLLAAGIGTALMLSRSAPGPETAAPAARPTSVGFEGDHVPAGTGVEHEGYEEPLALGAADTSVTADMGVTYTEGNNQNNTLNGGRLAWDGEWYYYTGNDGDRLHRIREDGSGEETLTDFGVGYISVYEGWVYCVNEEGALLRMRPDGGSRETLVERGAEYARIKDGRIWYGEFTLCSAAPDGGDQRQENEIDGNELLMSGEYIYYTDPHRGQHLYRAAIDGSGAVCICNRRVTNLRIGGDKLFFYDWEEEWSAVYDLSTGEVSQLSNDPVNDPVITREGIYGFSGSKLRLVFLRHGQVGVKTLTDYPADRINAAGNRIFFRNCEDYQYYMMDPEGGSLIKL